MATLRSVDTAIDEVDGTAGGFFTDHFEVLPGARLVAFHLKLVQDDIHLYSVKSPRLCFVAQAGHSYLAIAHEVGYRRWQPKIVDESSGTVMRSHLLGPDQKQCPPAGPDDADPPALIAGYAEDDAPCDPGRWKFACFFKQVKRQIQPHWNPVAAYRGIDPRGELYAPKIWETVLVITLRASGALADVRVFQPSGADVLDQAAVGAVQEAQPFPAPPRQLVEPDGLVRFKFGLRVDTAGPEFVHPVYQR